MPLDIVAFVRKWNARTLTERSAAQQHFRDLCEALGVPHPTEADEIGASYSDQEILARLRALNHERATAQGSPQ